MAQYRRGPAAEHHAKSKRARKSMLLYTGSFFLCWVLPLILGFVAHHTEISALHSIANALYPLMGFFNVLVFVMPKCLKHQEDRPGIWLATAYLHVLCGLPLAAAGRWVATR